MVTKAELQKFLPNAKPALVAAVVDNWSEAVAAGITTPLRIRHFLANIATETGGLTAIVESMTYTSASRIRETWPTRFKTNADAQPYVRQAKKLAIKVYGGRMGNRPAPSTDGWDYRGGGMLQTSGADGYDAMGFKDNPSVLQSNPKIAFLTAVREWKKRGCNALADKNDAAGVRRAINGGTIGLAEVKAYLTKAKTIWPDSASTPKPATEITNPVMVKEVQEVLKKLGYTEVGGADGVIGTMTRSAILAFRADHGLPLAAYIDDEFMDALKTAQPRQIAKERVLADSTTVASKVPEVKANVLSKILSAITAAISSIFAMIVGVFDQFEDAKAYVDPVKEYAASIPGWFWLVMIAVLALAIFSINRRGEKKGVEAFQNGERR